MRGFRSTGAAGGKQNGRVRHIIKNLVIVSCEGNAAPNFLEPRPRGDEDAAGDPSRLENVSEPTRRASHEGYRASAINAATALSIPFATSAIPASYM
jgi:hypothetical protein